MPYSFASVKFYDLQTYPNGCQENQGPCSGNNNNNRGPKTETTYVYRERDGKCIREQITTKVEDPDACSCIARESCAAGDVVNVDNTSGVRVNTNRVNVDVNGNSGVNVVVRRGRRQVVDFLDAIFGPPSRSAPYHYGSIFDFIPKIDVAVNRPGLFGNRGVNVNIGNGQGVRVGVNHGSRPFFTFGLGPNSGSGFPSVDNRDNSGENCPNCGGPAPPVRPTRRRVYVTPSPTPRCSAGQVSTS